MFRQAWAFLQSMRQRGGIWDRWGNGLKEKFGRVRRLWTMAGWRRRLRALEQRTRFLPNYETLEARVVPANVLTAFQLTNDPVNALQTNIAEVTVTPGTGSYMLTQPLSLNVTPDSSFGSPNLVYDSTTVDDMPMIEAELATDSGSALPTMVYMNLSIWDAAGGATSTYSQDFNIIGSPGNTFLMGVPILSNPVSTGLFDWTMAAYGNSYANLLATTSGQAIAVNEISGPFGAGWGLSGVDQLISVNGGSDVIWATGTGQERLYVESTATPGLFTNPENFGSLVETANNGTDTFTYTAVDQSESIFNVSNQSSNVFDLAQVIDTGHSLTENLTYDSSDRLTEIAFPDGSTAGLVYGTNSVTINEPGGDSVVLDLNGSNDLTSIVDADGNTRSLAYSGHEVTTDSWSPYDTTLSYDLGYLDGVEPSGSGLSTITSAEYLSIQPPSSNATLVNSQGLITTVVDSTGDTMTYAVDPRDRELFQEDPLGDTETFQRLSDTPGTAATQYGPGLVTNFTDAMGDSTSLGYDASGSLTLEVSPNGGATLYLCRAKL